MVKTRKRKNLVIFGCILIIFLIFNLSVSISYSSAQGHGNKHQGSQSHEDGMKRYQFNNNVCVNFSTTSDITVDLEIDENLSNRFIGFYLNVSDPITFSFQARKNFEHSPEKKMTWNKKFGSNFGSGLDEQIYTNHLLKKSITSSLEDDILLVNSDFQANIVSEDDPEEEFDIEYEYNTYFQIDLDGPINSLDIFTLINSNLGISTSESSSLSWAIFDNETQTWSLLSSEIDGDILNTTFEGVNIENNQIILTIVNFSPISAENFWTSTAGIILIIGISIFAIFGLIMSNSEYRNYLLNRIVHINAGPHRLTMEQILENENRDRIITIILEQPGIHFNELMRKLSISAGTLVWHLDILETFKVIQKQRVGQYLVYYPYLVKNPISKLDLKLQKSRTTLEILQLVNDHPGMYQQQIARRMDLNHKTIKYHINKLIEIGLVSCRKNGRRNFFYPKEITKSKN